MLYIADKRKARGNATKKRNKGPLVCLPEQEESLKVKRGTHLLLPEQKTRRALILVTHPRKSEISLEDPARTPLIVPKS